MDILSDDIGGGDKVIFSFPGPTRYKGFVVRKGISIITFTSDCGTYHEYNCWQCDIKKDKVRMIKELIEANLAAINDKPFMRLFFTNGRKSTKKLKDDKS